MGELIELIINLIAAALGNQRSAPTPPRVPPQTWTPPPQPPSMGGRQPGRPAPTRRLPPRVPLKLKRPVAKLPGRRRPAPPPLPPAPSVAKPANLPEAPPVPSVAVSKPAISASTIHQLIHSRPTAMRSIFVFSEVIRPPLALRRSPSELL